MKLDESGTLEVSRPDLEIYLRRDAVIGFRADYANCKAADSSNIPGCNEDELRPHLTLLLSIGGEIEVRTCIPGIDCSTATHDGRMGPWRTRDESVIDLGYRL